jgi:hypothetical protein
MEETTVCVYIALDRFSVRTMLAILVVLLTAHALCSSIQQTTATGVEMRDTMVVGAQAIDTPAQRSETLTVGYDHRLTMRGGIKALAQRYVEKYPTRAVRVLDPRNMFRWTDQEKTM